MDGFLVVFRPWGPVGCNFFVFFVALFILFCFYLQQNTYCCYFYFFPVFLFCFLHYLFSFVFCFIFLINFAFSFRKIISFLLVPLVLKFENTFFLCCFI